MAIPGFPDIGKALDAIPKLLNLSQAPQQQRSELIHQANDMAAAIALAAGYSIGRLNKVVQAPTEPEKLQIIGDLLNGHEIESFSRVNSLCGDIHSSANALRNWWTGEAASVNVQGRQDAERVFAVLSDGEVGAQQLFQEILIAPGDLAGRSAAEIDVWAKGAIGRLAETMRSTSEAVAHFARII
jgi:hypothetical protein